MKGKRVMKLLRIVVLAVAGLFSASAWAEETGTDARCMELQQLVLELSDSAFHPTRDPVIRDDRPERNFIWCLGIGYAQFGEGRPVEAVILSFGTEPDGTVWLDFWEKRKEPFFKWKGARAR